MDLNTKIRPKERVNTDSRPEVTATVRAGLRAAPQGEPSMGCERAWQKHTLLGAPPPSVSGSRRGGGGRYLAGVRDLLPARRHSHPETPRSPGKSQQPAEGQRRRHLPGDP